MTDIQITPTVSSDLAELADVVAATGLFPADLLAALWDQGQADGQVWHTARIGPRAVGLAFSAPEPLTDGTWNMRALCVAPALQGQGVGRALVQAQKTALSGRGRLLLVDTSGSPAFAGARAFYTAIGYALVAEIPDYWADGDAKVVFTHPL